MNYKSWLIMDNVEAIYDAPEKSGAYFESKCKNILCNDFSKKVYIYLGNSLLFDYYEKSKEYLCNQCSTIYSIYNIGFLNSK